MSDLAAALARYLEVRQHTLSTAHLTGLDQLVAEARYVRGEATELRDAVDDYVAARNFAQFEADPESFGVGELRDVRYEIADVVLAATCLAGMLPGDVTVEACIAEKTEHDRGRG